MKKSTKKALTHGEDFPFLPQLQVLDLHEGERFQKKNLRSSLMATEQQNASNFFYEPGLAVLEEESASVSRFGLPVFYLNFDSPKNQSPFHFASFDRRRYEHAKGQHLYSAKEDVPFPFQVPRRSAQVFLFLLFSR